LAYEVTDRFAVDLAYRYADLGTAKSSAVTPYDGTAGYSGVDIQDITTNDLILGFRYKLQRDQPVMYAVK
jgi:opacity protein-like surface antigen